MADAMEKWPNSEENNETVCLYPCSAYDKIHTYISQGFSLSNNSDKSMFDIFADNPGRASRFGMYFSRDRESPNTLLDNYAWAEKETMVDVGGSHGSVAINIAERFPHIKCVVQDLPDTVAEGDFRLPAGLRGRVTFMAQQVDPRPCNPNTRMLICVYTVTFSQYSQSQRMYITSAPSFITGQTSIASKFFRTSSRL